MSQAIYGLHQANRRPAGRVMHCCQALPLLIRGAGHMAGGRHLSGKALHCATAGAPLLRTSRLAIWGLSAIKSIVAVVTAPLQTRILGAFSGKYTVDPHPTDSHQHAPPQTRQLCAQHPRHARRHITSPC